MKQSLLWRFVLIIVAVAFSAFIVSQYPIRFGIDLAGGTSLLYELDLAKLDQSNLDVNDIANRVIEVLRKRVDPSSQKNLIWRVVGGKRIQIEMPQAPEATKLARKDYNAALDALGMSNLRQSVILSAISQTGPARLAKINELAPEGTPRHQLLLEFAAANDEMNAVRALVAKVPDQNKMSTELTARMLNAEDALATARANLDQTNVDMAKLKILLAAAENQKNTAARDELKALPTKYPAQKKVLEDLLDAHHRLLDSGGLGQDDPADLQRMITGAGVLDFRIALRLGDEPNDVVEHARQSLREHGPGQPIQNLRWFAVDESGRDNFVPVHLVQNGDTVDSIAKLHSMDVRAIEAANPGVDLAKLQPGQRISLTPFVVDSWAGQPYVLMYDDPGHTLTHATGRKWSVTGSRLTNDPHSGSLALSFDLDPIGGILFGDLTEHNIKHPMAILLDDRAISAPTIQTAITGGGCQITFGETTATHTAQMVRKEADNLRQILDAGSLPAALQHDPISVEEISSEFGAENVTAGKNSAYFAVLSVIAFMLVYYTITGFFADVAVLINLLITLAVMAMFGATLTLPGIAGIVLTLGMAVDANVLINERIREELHKGASLWMAVRQGYDKVFWTIFDANTTCSLTSIVLIFVGSEEVKGFGITLLIGLMIHMFTALFVTRTFMMAAIKWGVLRAIDDHSVGEYFREIFTFTWLRRGHWPFMKVITVTNFDWIGKRHIFWCISAAVTLAGLVAFIARGEDKYDTEFRGGTQVTFELKTPPATKENPAPKPLTMHRDEIERRVKAIADLPELTPDERVHLADLKNSTRVVAVGTSTAEASKFKIQTTIADTKDVKIKQRFLDLLAKQFSDVLDVKPTVSIREGKATPKDLTDLMNKGIIVPITHSTLDQTFDNTPITGMPNRDLTDYVGGVAILLDNIDPPQTAEQLQARIAAARLLPEMNKVPNRTFTIIPLLAVDQSTTRSRVETAETYTAAKSVAATEDDARPLTRAVMVTSDPNAPYDANVALWQDKVASTEWQIVQLALATESRFTGVTSFDAVVASQAKFQALLAIVLSLVLIVIYVWVRFGGLRYGIGAILSLVHDAIVALAATVLAKYLAETWIGPKLLITDFKINLTMIAAYLTIIGYSVNDTIVIFDRVRELRGRGQQHLTAKLVNDAINQCFGRTIWTTFTVFIVVLVMYVFGGEGVRGFSYAMLIGVITGAYSTLAIASPMLLTVKESQKKTPPANPFLQQIARVPTEDH